MKSYPKCKSVSKHRMKRRGVSRYIRGSKAYACDNCNKQYFWVQLINRTF